MNMNSINKITVPSSQIFLEKTYWDSFFNSYDLMVSMYRQLVSQELESQYRYIWKLVPISLRQEYFANDFSQFQRFIDEIPDVDYMKLVNTVKQENNVSFLYEILNINPIEEKIITEDKKVLSIPEYLIQIFIPEINNKKIYMKSYQNVLFVSCNNSKTLDIMTQNYLIGGLIENESLIKKINNKNYYIKLFSDKEKLF